MKTPTDSLQRSSFSTAFGFTLVELLVTIAIVAILATLGVSVSTKMLGKARETACQNNLRQIGVLMSGHAANNNNFYPAGGNPEGYIRRACRDQYAEYPDTGGGKDAAFFRDGPGKFFICPHDKEGQKNLTKSYLANGRIVGTSDKDSESGWKEPYGPRNIASISEPSLTFLVIEHWVPKTKLWRGNDVKNSPEWKGANFHAHGEGRHYLYVDGHLEFHVEDPGLEGDQRKIHYHGE